MSYYDFNKENTLIIVGKSPILDNPEVEQMARLGILRYHNIGINQACYLFKTEYLALVDAHIKMYYDLVHPNTKVISIYNNATEKLQGEFYDSFIPKDYENTYPIREDGALAYCGFTHDLCLSWAILKGFKNVVLFGVADFTNSTYLNKCQTLIDRPTKFNCSDFMRINSIKYINNVYSKYLNIYTANPESALNVPRLDIAQFA